jgi:hypothetical protein
MTEKRHQMLLALILLTAFLCRLYHIDHPPVDYHNWRQTQTLMVARNFAEGDMNLFRPSIDWRTTDGPTDNGTVGGTELQIVPWLTALLYRLFGIHHWVGRVVPIFFSLLGLFYFHRLVARFFDSTSATLGTLLLSVSPMYLFFGRVQMPEPFVFALSFAALFYFDRCLCQGKKLDYLLATVCCLFMILGKPQMAVMVLPLLFLAALRLGWRLFLHCPLYVIFGFVAGPFLLFLWYSNSVLLSETGLSFSQPGLLNFGVLKTMAYHKIIWERIFLIVLGPVVCALAVAGLFRPFRTYGGWLPYVWLMGALAFFFALPGGNSANSYYQMVIIPPACIFAGRFLGLLFSRRLLMWAAWGLLVLATLHGFHVASGFFGHRDRSAHFACGEWIKTHVAEDALILTDTPNPSTLYFADRKGWTCWYEHYGKPIRFNAELIARLKTDKGAAAIAIPDGSLFDDARLSETDRYAGLRDQLHDSYFCYRGADFVVFLLDRAADLGLPEDGRIAFDNLESRKYLRGSWHGNQVTQEGESFVAMGPGKQAGLRFSTRSGQQRLHFNLSTAVASQTVYVALDDKEVARVHMPHAWTRRTIKVPLPTEHHSEGPHTLTFSVEKQNAEGVGLLLFSVEDEKALFQEIRTLNKRVLSHH